MSFSKILINWYLKNKRELPWRQTSDPYRIWLSEIMLQQTRINQGLPYYLRFTDEFPTVFDLAKAPQQQVLKLWQGLGYYSRARNLHETAKYVAQELGGTFPGSYKDLLKLKGVGDYTASAIASISYKEPVAVVDGNVYRVLSRYFNVATAINSPAGVKEFKKLATEVLDSEKPGMYNQAIMEFGALHCKPQNPMCDSCPLSDSCLALKLQLQNELPVKIRKGKIKNRFFNYLVFLTEENKTLLEQRSGKGIWEGLYQFPLIETSKLISPQEFLKKESVLKLLNSDSDEISLYNEDPVVHKLSHQHIYTRFWIIQKTAPLNKGIDLEELKKYPVPVLIANFLNDFNLTDY
ncbi:MAG: A/G-specific adenine glycosylase [Gillisia sp.]